MSNILDEKNQDVICVMAEAESIQLANEGKNGNSSGYKLKFFDTTLMNIDKIAFYNHQTGFSCTPEPGEWFTIFWFGCKNAVALKALLIETMKQFDHSIESNEFVFSAPINVARSIIFEVYRQRKDDAAAAAQLVDHINNQRRPGLFARFIKCITRK
jgi:hypothetical protein